MTDLPSALPRPSSVADTQRPSVRERLDLSVTQVLGGALAAMTAAALGSTIGVGGTIVGAALASVVAAVGGSLYTASLRHTREKVKTVWTGRVAGTEVAASVAVVPEDAAQSFAPQPRTTGSTLPWRSILVGALAAFGLAAILITGFEALSGHALSGERGTTITRVSQPQDPAPAKPAPVESTGSPESTATRSVSPTAEPSDSPVPEQLPSSTPVAPTAAPSSAAPAPSSTAPSTAPTTADPSTANPEPSASSTTSSAPAPSASSSPSGG